ncbi:MAG: hypothetical protein ACYCXG_05545 [Acidiferrobacter sp.]
MRTAAILVGVGLVLTSMGSMAGLRTLRAAAAAGQPAAELQLGELYQYGVGQAHHRVQALMWYERAQAQLPRAARLAHRLAATLTPAARRQAAALAAPRLGPPTPARPVHATVTRARLTPPPTRH